MTPRPIVLTAASDLAAGTTAERFDGAAHGDGVAISFFLSHTPPGCGARPHRHPYGEVFVLADGEATFDVDGASVVARGGQVVVVPAGAVHGFPTTGRRPREMTSIHAAAAMMTEWIEEA